MLSCGESGAYDPCGGFGRVRSGCAADVWMRTWKHTVRAAQRTRLDPEEVSPDVC